MKTSLIAALLCLVPSLTASAEDVRFNGAVYKLQTVHPVTVDGFGRVIPLRPMTVLVPVPEVSPSQATTDSSWSTRRIGLPAGPVFETHDCTNATCTKVVDDRTRTVMACGTRLSFAESRFSQPGTSGLSCRTAAP